MGITHGFSQQTGWTFRNELDRIFTKLDAISKEIS
jgi:hypothetical protein